MLLFVDGQPDASLADLYALAQSAEKGGVEVTCVLVGTAARPRDLPDYRTVAITDPTSVKQRLADILDDANDGFHLDVFLSYARKDHEFALELVQTLRRRGKRVWLDQHVILPAESWVSAVRSGIDAADHFVFLLSPDSVRSGACVKELEWALEQQKRIIPVMCRDVSIGEIPESIRDLTFVRLTDDAALIAAFENDPHEARFQARLAVRSREWVAAGADPARLLRGRALRDVEYWFQDHPNTYNTSPIIDGYIRASQQARRKGYRIVAALAVPLVAVPASLVFAALWPFARDRSQYYDHRLLLVILSLIAAAGVSALYVRRLQAREGYRPPVAVQNVLPVVLASCLLFAAVVGVRTAKPPALVTALRGRDFGNALTFANRADLRNHPEVPDAFNWILCPRAEAEIQIVEQLFDKGLQPSSDHALDCLSTVGTVDALARVLGRIRLDATWNPALTDALDAAAIEGRSDVVKYLLGRGVKPSSVGLFRSVYPLLVDEVREKQLQGEFREIVRMLLASHTLDVDARDPTSEGETALQKAAFHGDIVIVGMLLDAGASVNHQDSRGYTPLINAVHARHLDIAQLLVRSGADPQLRTTGGQRALEFAESQAQLFNAPNASVLDFLRRVTSRR